MNDTRAKLPSFIVLGQGKAGTSLMYRVFAANPAIALSKPKELNFFSTQYEKGLEWYGSHFADADGGKTVLEVSPSYLRPRAIRRIVKTLGSGVKVGFVLRRPIEQLYSRYLQDLCTQQDAGPFSSRAEVAVAKRQDRLVRTIAVCFRQFGRRNVLPLFFENDIAVPQPKFEERIYDFLGMDKSTYYYDPVKHANINRGVFPHYIFSKDEPTQMVVDGVEYRIPKNTLVFCGQSRNSMVTDDPASEVAAAALERQREWTPEVSEEEYADLQKRWVEPLSRRLESEFGFDLSHWRNPPRRLAYKPASPPKKFAVGR